MKWPQRWKSLISKLFVFDVLFVDVDVLRRVIIVLSEMVRGIFAWACVEKNEWGLFQTFNTLIWFVNDDDNYRVMSTADVSHPEMDGNKSLSK